MEHAAAVDLVAVDHAVGLGVQRDQSPTRGDLELRRPTVEARLEGHRSGERHRSAVQRSLAPAPATVALGHRPEDEATGVIAAPARDADGAAHPEAPSPAGTATAVAAAAFCSS